MARNVEVLVALSVGFAVASCGALDKLTKHSSHSSTPVVAKKVDKPSPNTTALGPQVPAAVNLLIGQWNAPCQQTYDVAADKWESETGLLSFTETNFVQTVSIVKGVSDCHAPLARFEYSGTYNVGADGKNIDFLRNKFVLTVLSQDEADKWNNDSEYYFGTTCRPSRWEVDKAQDLPVSACAVGVSVYTIFVIQDGSLTLGDVLLSENRDGSTPDKRPTLTNHVGYTKTNP